MIAVTEAPVAGWVPWAVTAVMLAALTLYWAWPRGREPSEAGCPVIRIPTLKEQHQPRPWRCTGQHAVWCPLCGPCSCSTDEATCSLHAPVSEHPHREVL